MQYSTPIDRRRRLCARTISVLPAVLIATLSSALLVPIAGAEGRQTQVNLDARNSQGLTQLILAASSGEVDTVLSLVSRGANVNATAADGRTALIAAVQNNRIDAVKALIKAGADLNIATRGGAALEIAERKDETEIAALLLASGAHSSGKSAGDTVCVLPWGGDGFCGKVKSFTVRSVDIQITKIVGCAGGGCRALDECSASQLIGGARGLQPGDRLAVPSWCLTKTGVKE